MERLKNGGLVFCLFVVLLVIFSSYFRANELGALCGALAGTPLLVHVFNRLVPVRPRTEPAVAVTTEAQPSGVAASQCPEQVFVLRLEGPNGRP